MIESRKEIRKLKSAKISLYLVISSFILPFIGLGLLFKLHSDVPFIVTIILSIICAISGISLGITTIIINDNIEGKGSAVISILLAIIYFLVVMLAWPGHNVWERNRRYAKVNLNAIYYLQKSYHYHHNSNYAKTFEELGWRPEQDAFYAYFLTTEEVIQPKEKIIQRPGWGPHSLPPGVNAFIGKYEFQIVAVGNIDSDEGLDVLMINEDGKLKILERDLGMWPWSW